MKLWKHTLITAFAFVGIASTVLYSSCEKDSCLDLKCRNRGSCSEGYCRCQTGFEGTECEIKSADKFIGIFVGNKTCVSQSPISDTMEVFMFEEPNKVKFVQYSRIYDTLTGTVDGDHMSVDQIVSGNYIRNVSGDVVNNKLTIYNEEILNVNTASKVVCNFIGFK